MLSSKKEKMDALNAISKILINLDQTLSEMDSSESPDAHRYTVRKWYEDKKALHEIKRALYQVGQYSRYDEKELNPFISEYSGLFSDEFI